MRGELGGMVRDRSTETQEVRKTVKENIIRKLACRSLKSSNTVSSARNHTGPEELVTPVVVVYRFLEPSESKTSLE